MRRITTILFITVLLMSFVGVFAQTFNKNTDLLLANFDLCADEDDIMSAAALACMLIHSDYEAVNYFAVAGATGIQEDPFISNATPDLFNQLFGSEDINWTDADKDWADADKDWAASVTRAKNKIIPILNAGGKVFVQEAGQSDITCDILQAVIADGVSSSTVKANVVVVQHAGWNQRMTTPEKLDWVRSNTTYVNIAVGNLADNGTPGYNSNTTTFLTQALSASNPNAAARAIWTIADYVCKEWTITANPRIVNGGVDFSDHVENWYIFDLGDSFIPGEVDTDIAAFWNAFVVNETGTTNGPPVVSFITPLNKQYIDLGEDVPVEVSATDNDSISNVKLYRNDTLVSEKVTAPYSWTTDAALKNMAAGTYTLKAVAEDNTGNTSEISISITVRVPTTPTISGYYHIIKYGTSACLYAGEDSEMKEDDPVTLLTMVYGDSSMVWVEYDRGDGYYYYQKINTNYCLDGGDGGANNQAILISEYDDENINQHWEKEVIDSGASRLIKRDALFAINGGAVSVDGQEVNLWRSTVGSANLHWTFTPAFTDISTIKEENALDVNIYPNPASDFLMIETEQDMSRVDVYSIQG